LNVQLIKLLFAKCQEKNNEFQAGLFYFGYVNFDIYNWLISYQKTLDKREQMVFFWGYPLNSSDAGQIISGEQHVSKQRTECSRHESQPSSARQRTTRHQHTFSVDIWQVAVIQAQIPRVCS